MRRQRLDRALEADALLELAQVGLGQQVVQLRLAAEDDLQQLVAVGLEVQEQANLFEQVLGQQVGFVNDQHSAQALRVPRHQNVAEGAQHGGFRGLRRQAEFARQQVEEFFGRE